MEILLQDLFTVIFCGVKILTIKFQKYYGLQMIEYFYELHQMDQLMSMNI